jgi:hypothetical protein
MPTLDINLDEVKEKPRMPADKYFTFMIKQATVEMAKQANKNTGKIEPYIKAVLSPLEADWNSYTVYHNWSLSPGALESPEPAFSIRKFFLVVGHEWGSDGKFSTEDLMTIKFIGTVKYKEGDSRPNLDKVLKAE